MKLRILILGLATGGAAGILASAALADPPARVGRISNVEGGVSFQPPQQTDWTWATMNFPVVAGEAFWTGDDGRTELQIGGVIASLDSETEFDVVDTDYGHTEFALTQGSVNIRIWSPVRGGVSISTPAGNVTMDRPGLYRVDVGAPGDDGAYPQVEVTALDGEALAPSPEGFMPIEAGQAALVYAGYDPQLQDAEDTAIDDWARRRWAQARWTQDEALPAAMTGAAVLASYGEFMPSPDYGRVWFPRDVPADWAPYRYGHWAYVAPWGYTWIDDQPWGFAPFHYGRWVQVEGRWGWIAGQPQPEPVYAPALVAFIGVPGLNVGVSVGGSGLGWVPLGPEEVYRPTYEVSSNYIRNVNVSNVRTETINRVIVNNVTINNVTYRNAAAATVVPAAAFSGGRPVQRAAVAVSASAIANAQSVRPAIVAPPTPAALSGAVHREGAAPVVRAAPPPARLAVVRAAVVAHPVGASKPPVIAGARLTAPAPRPAGAPARVSIAPAQAKEPAARPIIRAPTAAPANGSSAARPIAPAQVAPMERPATPTPPPGRSEVGAPVGKPEPKATPVAPERRPPVSPAPVRAAPGENRGAPARPPAETEAKAPIGRPEPRATPAAPERRPPVATTPARAVPDARAPAPPPKAAPDARSKDAVKKTKPATEPPA